MSKSQSSGLPDRPRFLRSELVSPPLPITGARIHTSLSTDIRKKTLHFPGSVATKSDVESILEDREQPEKCGNMGSTHGGENSPKTRISERNMQQKTSASRVSIATFGPARFSKRLSNRNSMFAWKPEFTTVLIARRVSIGDPSELRKQQQFKSRRSMAEADEFTIAAESHEEKRRRHTHQPTGMRGAAAMATAHAQSGLSAADELAQIKAAFRQQYASGK